jgi:hypothetical protein
MEIEHYRINQGTFKLSIKSRRRSKMQWSEVRKLHPNHWVMVTAVRSRFGNGKQIVDNVVVDTGAIRSIMNVDTVEELDINPSPTDLITRVYGIGGDNFSFRKLIGDLSFNSLREFGFPLTLMPASLAVLVTCFNSLREFGFPLTD